MDNSLLKSQRAGTAHGPPHVVGDLQMVKPIKPRLILLGATSALAAIWIFLSARAYFNFHFIDPLCVLNYSDAHTAIAFVTGLTTILLSIRSARSGKSMWLPPVILIMGFGVYLVLWMYT